MPGIDLNYFIRQANKLTEKIEQRKQELANETVEAKSGEGRVTVVANGIQEIRSIKIDKSAIDQRADVARLSSSLVSDLKAKGVGFIDVQQEDFRNKLASTGFYGEWKSKYGSAPWDLLEKVSGKLG